MKEQNQILLLIILVTACTASVDEKPIFDPFEINYSMTEKGLLDSNYEVIPKYVPLLGKQVGDTLIYYQLNEECDSLTRKCVSTNVSHRFCFIHLDSADSLTLQKLVSRYDADIISEFLHQNEINLDGTNLDSASHAARGFHGKFYVKHRYTKQIFECYVGRARGTIDNKMEGFELNVDTDFPWTNDQIKESGWIYK